MVIRMGEIAEACNDDPPPCWGAVCACAGGGFAGSAGPLVEPTCIPYLDAECEDADELCDQCLSESGCASGIAKSGDEPMTCKKNGGGIKCVKGENRP